MKTGRSGRGPTRLMSPRNTFQSCGSSSSPLRRRKPPIGVVRGSLLARPDGSLALGVGHHGAELHHAEDAPVEAHALLHVEDGGCRW